MKLPSGRICNQSWSEDFPSGEAFIIDDLILAAVIGGFINTAVQGMSGNISSTGDFFGSPCSRRLVVCGLLGTSKYFYK